MTDHWITPTRIFDGKEMHNGLALRLSGGRVVELANRPDIAHPVAGLVTPGYLDLQVNGGGGVLLNTSPTVEGLRTILNAHRRFGTVGLMPTVITDHPDVLDRAADAAIAARDLPGMIGLHIEGPHISVPRRGTHKAAFVRPMDDRTIGVVKRLRAADLRVMITLAPEAATLAQIAQLAAMGAIVSLGHTDATAEQVMAAMAAGATCATHLFNAMSPMQSRAPGTVGAVINGRGYAGIICDGQHVDDMMVGMALRARPVPDRMFLVSDAMATVGGPNTFELYDQRITLADGRLVNDEGSLAGAHITQAQGVQRLIEYVGASPVEALRMVTSNPAACIGAPDLAELLGRKLDDILLLDDHYSVRSTLAAAVMPEVVTDESS